MADGGGALPASAASSPASFRPGGPEAPRAGGIDRNSPLPLWAQLAADLRRRLAADEFAERLPTESELVEHYDVSRHTVREALRHLRAEGVITARQGQGTFVVRSELDDRVGGLHSLARAIRAQGLEEWSRVLVADLVPASAQVADALCVAEEEGVVRLVRLRLAGPEPVSLDRSWLPADLAKALLEADLSTGGVYEVLHRHCGVGVTGASTRIRPAEPSAEDRLALELPEGEAVLLVERTSFAGDRVVEWRQSLLRGDRYELIASWGAPLGRQTGCSRA
jgi:GntR family transcriptional regulator